ncbi:MAG: cell envelope integrity protein CreD [Pseudomonadota bacterium]
MRSTGTRFFIVGLLALFMFVPLFFASGIVEERAYYSRETSRELGQEWGGPQTLSGPQMVVPVTETVLKQVRKGLTDPTTGQPLLDSFGRAVQELADETEEIAREPIFLLPDTFDVAIEQTMDSRRRGIFEVPVYRANADISFDFDIENVDLGDTFTIHWDRAELVFALGSNRALRGNTRLVQGGVERRLDPRPGGGLRAPLTDPRESASFALTLGFQGAERLEFVPVGRTSRVSLTGDWPHPSFVGAFLPDSSDIQNDGFSANWTIPHLARALPQFSRVDQLEDSKTWAFGMRFVQPNDVYQKAYRAARYGILFIALTFLAVLLIEDRRNAPTHPVQYILIGLVECLFVVILVAYAEQIGFSAAYGLASLATVGLITFYAITGLKLGRRAWLLGAVLAVLYALLFLVMRSADYALLAGASLVFLALSGAMYGTRDEEWYGGGAWSLLPRRKKAAVPSGEGGL